MQRIPFLSDNVQRFTRRDPKAILGKTEREALSQLNTPEHAALSTSLIEIPVDYAPSGPWLGMTAGGPDRPDIVLTGICRGRSDAENAQLEAYGPLVEYLYGLDLAYSVARRHSAEYHVWLLDQEACNTAISGGRNPQNEIRIADRMAAFVLARYPEAKLFRSSVPLIRSNMYAILAETPLAEFYPHGIVAPFGLNRPNLWESIEYLSCITLLLYPTRQAQRVWVVLDHDQIRPCIVASHLSDLVRCLFFWPVPGLLWPGSRRQHPHNMIRDIREVPRRMYRSRNLSGMLFCGESISDIVAKVRNLAQQDLIPIQTLHEIISYLEPESRVEEQSVEMLAEILARTINIVVSRKH